VHSLYSQRKTAAILCRRRRRFIARPEKRVIRNFGTTRGGAPGRWYARRTAPEFLMDVS
jgi:hypothetical protein